jgi:hypothetical protein
VQQPVCIVLAARQLGKDSNEPARVYFRSLREGRREEKFKELNSCALADADWIDCPTEWRAPFLPAATGLWADAPALEDFFIYNGSGVMPGRTWIIAPDAESLRLRWNRLVREKDEAKKEVLFHPHEGATEV